MKSELGITVKKDDDFSEWYSQVIQKAELADIRHGIQGFLVHRPWGFFIIRKIYEYLEEEVERKGHLPFLFPVSVKEKNLTKEKEHAGFTPDVFWVNEAGDKKIEEKFALRPTGEAQIYPLYALWFRSHKDLPFKGYQSRISVFRNEMTTRPFLRGREFPFFEAHNVFTSRREVEAQIKEDLEICKKVIYDKIKIPFLYFKRPYWDKFLGADFTYTPDTIMPDGKRNQLASTHDLGQNFSKAFNIKIVDAGGNEEFVRQTCFGPGIWRIIAALIAVHGDDNGLIIPFDMCPIQIVAIPITFAKKQKENIRILEKAKIVRDKIRKLGYRVKLDDSEETPGFKYNKWELQGVPLRLEIGPKEIKEGSLTLSVRTEKKKRKIKINNLGKGIRKYAKILDDDIKKNADSYFKNKTRNATSFEELKELINKYKGFIKVPFCSIDKDGKECGDKLKYETEGGYVCGTLYPKEEGVKRDMRCIICKKKANHLVYVAKSY